MARSHAKLSDRIDESEHLIRQRNAGGKLHRRGQGRRLQEEASRAAGHIPAVVHVEKAEFALEAKIVAALASVNAKIAVRRAAEANRVLEQARQARRDICNIAHVPSAAARNVRTAASIIAHCRDKAA